MLRYYRNRLGLYDLNASRLGDYRIVTFRTLLVPTADPHASDPRLYDLHKIRCTREQDWYGSGPRNDFFLYRFRECLSEEEPRTAMENLAVGQAVRIIKVLDPTAPRLCVLIRPMETLGGGFVGEHTHLVRVRRRRAGQGTDAIVIDFRAIYCAGHLGPEKWEGDTPITWFLNTTVDHRAFNLVY